MMKLEEQKSVLERCRTNLQPPHFTMLKLIQEVGLISVTPLASKQQISSDPHVKRSHFSAQLNIFTACTKISLVPVVRFQIHDNCALFIFNNKADKSGVWMPFDVLDWQLAIRSAVGFAARYCCRHISNLASD